ncbi:MAG: PilX N-terminal domain-containing pilus assembly protein [Pseudomonadota bacterium]
MKTFAPFVPGMRTHLRTESPPRRQTGIALISSLLVLVMLTLLAVSMFRGFGLQQKIGGNTREKERAHQAAENALQYGEWMLAQTPPGVGSACPAGHRVVTAATDMRVCDVKLANPTAPADWASAMDYTPPLMTVLAGGGTIAGGTDINYSKTPSLHIAYLGTGPDGKSSMYGVTAVGYAGTDSTTAVVQSVYAITSSVTPLDGPQ